MQATDGSTDDIGDESGTPPVRQPFSSVQPPLIGRRRFAIVIIAAVLLVAIVAGTIIRLRTLPSPLTPTHHLNPPIELPVYRDAQACQQQNTCTSLRDICPQDVAWAPDDSAVALLSDCVFENSAQVIVYDTHSGRLIQHLDLVNTIRRLSNAPMPGKNTRLCTDRTDGSPAITATSILWSRDSTRLIVPLLYTEAYPDILTTTSGCAGWTSLLLINADGSSPQAYFHANTDTSGTPGCYNVWDHVTGKLVPVPLDTSNAGMAFGCLKPALSYSWGASGALIPETPLPAPSAPVTNACPAPGDPNGGATVSIWQAGNIERMAARDKYQNTPPMYFWTTLYFAAASPDGRYIANVPATGSLVGPSGRPLPDSGAVAQAGLKDAPLLPVPGQVIEQRLDALPAGFLAYQDIAFRPDGRVVATGEMDAQLIAGGHTQHASKPVVLYDCSSGRQIVTLPPIRDSVYSESFNEGDLLQWSPDGNYLLFISDTYGSATLWGPGALPQ